MEVRREGHTEVRERTTALLGLVGRQCPALAEEIESRGHDAVTEWLLRKLGQFSTYGRHAVSGEPREAELNRLCFEQVASSYSVRRKATSPLRMILTGDEQMAILGKVKGDDLTAHRDRALLMTLFGCGLRPSEVVTLDLRHFRTRGRDADLLVRGIDGAQRAVPVLGRALDCLTEYVANRRCLSYGEAGDSRALFLMDQTHGSRMRMERLSRAALQVTFAKACSVARIESARYDVAFARHGFAVCLYAATSDLQLVGQVMDLRGIWLPRLGLSASPRRVRQGLEKLAVLAEGGDRSAGRYTGDASAE
jgi:integrase